MLEGYKKSVDLSAQAILDQTLLEKMHHIRHENTSLRTEKTLANSLFESSIVESAATLETQILEKRPTRSTDIKDEKSNTYQVEQQAFDLDVKDEIKLSPESMSLMINRLNMSIRQAALEIGVAHTTLSRYLRKENKRQNNKNDVKMLNWLKEKALTSV